jgi:hypothetical protein
MNTNSPAAARNAEVNARLATAIAKLPSLPALARSPRPLVRCACGCFGLTQRRFVPGHDAKLAAWVKRVERGVLGADPFGWIAENASTDAAEARSIAAAVRAACGVEAEVERSIEDVAMEAFEELRAEA